MSEAIATEQEWFELREFIAKSLYTSILYGGDEAEWDALPDRVTNPFDVRWSKDWFADGG